MITLFEELLERLTIAQVEYVLTGGLAVCLNGWVRLTDDVDILIDNSPENIRRLTHCLADFGEGHGADLTPDDLTNEPGAVRICEDFILDLFVQMSGKTLAEFRPWIAYYKLPSGIEVPYLSPEGLIHTKAGSLRQKDISTSLPFGTSWPRAEQVRLHPGSSLIPLEANRTKDSRRLSPLFPLPLLLSAPTLPLPGIPFSGPL